jgi:hypothetical protein
MSANTFTPGPTPNTVCAADGRILTVPEGKKGRKTFSRGVWAPATTIERIRGELEAEQSTESFAKKKEADARRRDKAQAEYVEDFHGAGQRPWGSLFPTRDRSAFPKWMTPFTTRMTLGALPLFA